MRALRILFGFLMILAAGFVGGFGYGRWYKVPPKSTPGTRILYYVDPMHPGYKSDRPGIAPDCGMKLVPVYEGQSAPAASVERKVLYYHDPQNAAYKSDKPGLNPETGNELEPVYAEQPATIQIPLAKQQLIGVKYGQAEFTSASASFHAVGKVALDETLVTRIHPKIEGWIDKVYFDFTGQQVNKGDPLVTIYSPEMLATEREFLLALKARDLLKHSTVPEADVNSETMIDAARRRLELWDLSKAQIEQIERTGEAIRSVTLYAPASGFVSARNAFSSQKVTPETELYAVTDLSSVWIMADVFEADAARVQLGQNARMTLPYQNGRSFVARVSYIQPQVDPATRTLKVRLQTANPGFQLKPDMFVDVEFAGGAPLRMTVPVDAVLDSGTRKVVFVDHGDGNLEPRTVETGDRTGDRIEIRKGLKPGERIVISGTFLIDSESQLRSAMSGTAMPEHAGHPGGEHKQ